MRSILVVDDKAINRDLLIGLLKGRGAATLEAGNGGEALEMVRAHRPDLVICDIYMPVMDGPEFVRRVRSDARIAGTKVIFWSSTYLDEEARILAGECGADGVIPKGGDAAEIRQAVQRLLESLPAAETPPGDLRSEELDRSRSGSAEPADLDGAVDKGPYFRSLIEQLPAIVYHMTVENPPRMLYISPRVETVLGYPRARWLEPPGLVPGAIHEADRAGFNELLAGLEKLGDSYETELRFVAADGRAIWFRDQGTVIAQTSEGVLTVQGVLSDVTERRQMEANLNQSQKMEAFGQLAGGVAHDFNNLLTVISGYTDFILQEVAPGSQAHEDATMIASTAERARSLTRQLLAFSRKQALQPAVFGLNGLIRETEKMLRRVIGEHIELTTDLSETEGFVKADPGQIDQVVMNLVVNARDAIGAGGRIALSTSIVERTERDLGTRPRGGFAASLPPPPDGGAGDRRLVRMSVVDSGAGMDEETLNRIFEPFFTTKQFGKGTGLGLATVHGIVRQSGGSIEVTSRPGKGTRFDIYLPQVARPEAPAPETRATAPASHGTLLVVDDDESVREVFRRALSECGYRVLTAENGDAALEFCRDLGRPIDLVVTDVVMPRCGGVALAAELRQIRPELSLLFVSGYTDDTLESQGLSGAVHFMNKPVVPEELVAKVRSILERGASKADGGADGEKEGKE